MEADGREEYMLGDKAKHAAGANQTKLDPQPIKRHRHHPFPPSASHTQFDTAARGMIAAPKTSK